MAYHGSGACGGKGSSRYVVDRLLICCGVAVMVVVDIGAPVVSSESRLGRSYTGLARRSDSSPAGNWNVRMPSGLRAPVTYAVRDLTQKA